MAHGVAARAETDLDEIWAYVAKESGSIDIASRVIDSITDRFLLLIEFPFMGRLRDEDLGARCRSFPVGEYLIVYAVEGEDIHILRVAHGRRDIEALFRR